MKSFNCFPGPGLSMPSIFRTVAISNVYCRAYSRRSWRCLRKRKMLLAPGKIFHVKYLSTSVLFFICLYITHLHKEVIPLWHRLQVIITKAQLKWLKAESYTKGKSISEILRNLIDAAISAQKKNSTFDNSTNKDSV